MNALIPGRPKSKRKPLNKRTAYMLGMDVDYSPWDDASPDELDARWSGEPYVFQNDELETFAEIERLSEINQ